MLLLSLAVALAAKSAVAVASVAVVAAMVLTVMVIGVDRVESSLSAYEQFRRTPRGLVLTGIVAVVTVVVWLRFTLGSGPSWALLLPILWTAGIAVNLWRLARRRSDPCGRSSRTPGLEQHPHLECPILARRRQVN